MRHFLICLIFLGTIPHCGWSQADSLSLKWLDNTEKKARKAYGSSLDSSLFYARAILDTCRYIDHPSYHAFALNWIGICYMLKGQPDSAELYYQKTITYAIANGEQSYIKKARLNRSINYHQQGMFEEAAKAAQSSLEVFKQEGDTLGIAHAQYNLGNSLFRLERYEEALTYYTATIPLYAAKGSPLNKANLYTAIGSVYYARKDYDEAIDQFLQSVKTKIEVGGENFCASEYINIANSYKHLKLTDRAIAYYHKSYRTAIQRGDKSKEANGYVDLAAFYSEYSLPDSAIYYALKAKKISQEINDRFLTYSSALVLSSAYHLKDRHKQAYLQLSEYNQIRDSLNTVEIQERISRIEKKFQLTQKDNQLLSQQLQLSQKEEALQKQVAIIIILVLIVLAVLIWMSNRRKKQQLNHQVAMNQERSRIAMDLHDHLGAELTIISSKLDTSAYKSERAQDRATLESLSDQVRDAGKILRETVWSIHKEAISIDELLAQIQVFAESVLQGSAIVFSSSSNAPEHRLAPHTALALYRVSQEAINNAYKHASPSNITVTADVIATELTITIKDDGIGFNPNLVKKGYGLDNITARVSQIGGKISMESNDEGTSIVILLDY